MVLEQACRSAKKEASEPSEHGESLTESSRLDRLEHAVQTLHREREKRLNYDELLDRISNVEGKMDALLRLVTPSIQQAGSRADFVTKEQLLSVLEKFVTKNELQKVIQIMEKD